MLIYFKKWLNRLIRFWSFKPKDRDTLIEMIRYAEKQNLLNPDALLMIEGALHVSELQVRDIMIPRVQMTVIEDHASLEAIFAAVVESGHSRFPVIADNNDEITGILLAKDLLNYHADPSKEFYIKDIMRPAVFIPESKRLNVLLREFRASHNHMAIVIDEYKGVAGLITIEDVIEEIIGEIEDEHDFDEDENNIQVYGNGRFVINALTAIEEFNGYFKMTMTDDEYDTVGGLVINAFGHLPKRGEMIDLEAFSVKVLRADKRRVQVLLFTLRNEKSERDAQT